MIIKRYNNWINEKSIADKEIEKHNTILKNITDYKIVCKYIDEIILELKDSLSGVSTIKFDEIDNDNNKLYFEIEYNADSEYCIKKLRKVLSESEGLEVYDKYFSLIYPDGEEKSFYVEIEIEKNHLNRVHVPVGLPYILKGLGLGKKIYKSLIYKYSYLSTNVLDRSMDAVFVWDSLRKDKEIYTFVRFQSVLCVSPELEYDKIEDLLVNFYNNLTDEDIILDDDFQEKYLKKIRNSNKISYLLDKK